VAWKAVFFASDRLGGDDAAEGFAPFVNLLGPDVPLGGNHVISLF
jgi:hypothetical protein